MMGSQYILILPKNQGTFILQVYFFGKCLVIAFVFSALSEQEQVVEKKLKEFTYGAELFRDRLGLTFKKTHGTYLQRSN